MALVAPRLLTLARLADVARQRAVVVGMQEIVNGRTIERAVVEEDAAGHAQAVDDGTPVAVGVGTVGLKLADHRQQGAAHHGGPFRRLVSLHQRHGPHQVEALDGAERRVVAVEPLQGVGVGVDDGQCLLRLSGLGKVQCGQHVALAAALGVLILAVAGHHLVGPGHLVAGVSGQYSQR